MSIVNVQKGPFNRWYSEQELKEFFDAFEHQCILAYNVDHSIPLKELFRKLMEFESGWAWTGVKGLLKGFAHDYGPDKNPKEVDLEQWNEFREMIDLLVEGFNHYECIDPKSTLKYNVSRLIGMHMHDAMEMERQRIININSWFYGKESFKLGDLHIETKPIDTTETHIL